jgi:23S rRNA pseudouridine1911/1915/1917 synthase
VSALRIAYRDGWLVVVDKPAGLPSQRTRDGTDGVYERLCQTEAYVGLHHRLDQRASGLLLLTVDKRANQAIAEGFRTHTIQRAYRVLFEGPVAEASWTWPVDGKPARTDVTPVAGEPRQDGLAEGVCRLHTGRMHQIRVHAAMNGTPVLGDTKYGGDLARPSPHLGLHAWRLELDHPQTGERLVVESPPPWAH